MLLKFTTRLGSTERKALALVRRNRKYGIKASTLASRITPTGETCHGYPAIRSLVNKCRVVAIPCEGGHKIVAL